MKGRTRIQESKTFKEEFKRRSPAEIIKEHLQLTGFENKAKALYQTVKELVENSLDATEMHGILPDIKVIIEEVDKKRSIVKVRVEDNGIGIPPQEIPKAFGTVFYGSKYVRRQTRGLFGLGVKAAVIYAQATTGVPVYIKSAQINSEYIYEYKISVDIAKNKPIIHHRRRIKNKDLWHGTIVELTLVGDWSRARSRIREYIKRTAIIAPYANLILKGPNILDEYKRTTTKLPPPPLIAKPHPRGIDIESLKMLIEEKVLENKLDPPTLYEFLLKEFDGVDRSLVKSFLEWMKMNPKLTIDKLSPDEISKLAAGMREFKAWKRPKAIALSPLGEELLAEGLRKVLEPEYVVAVSRKPQSYEGHPFIIEVGLAWGGKIPASEEPILLRYANKIPLIYDEKSCLCYKVVKRIDWAHYKVKFPAPLAILIHICSTKIPYSQLNKEVISEKEEIAREMESAIREAARKLKRYLLTLEREKQVRQKYINITKYIGEVSRALAIIMKSNAIGRKLEKQLYSMANQLILSRRKEILLARDLIKLKAEIKAPEGFIEYTRKIRR